MTKKTDQELYNLIIKGKVSSTDLPEEDAAIELLKKQLTKSQISYGQLFMKPLLMRVLAWLYQQWRLICVVQKLNYISIIK